MKKLMFLGFSEKSSGVLRSLHSPAMTTPPIRRCEELCSGAIHSSLLKYATYTAILVCSFLTGESTFAEMPTKEVVVGPYDTVSGIAYEHGITTFSLLNENKLDPDSKGRYLLEEGQVLTIPSPNEHTVRDGQTLEMIADRYGVNVDVLAQENNLRSPSYVSPGTRLTIPPHDTESINEALKPSSQEISTSSLAPLPLVKSAPPPDSHTPSVTPATTNASLPNDLAEELAREKGAKDQKPAVDSSSKPMLVGNLAQKNAGAPIGSTQDSQEITAEQKKTKIEEKPPEKKQAKKEEKKKEVEVTEVSFIWPVEGEVISKFTPGGKNAGINIKVSEGTPVKAAAEGTVMYAGNGLKGFGNLLLIKHKDGWITAYAHNSELLVKKDDKVKKGQEIAKSGKIGDVGEPQLHFEIRKGKQPIDPLTKLKA